MKSISKHKIGEGLALPCPFCGFEPAGYEFTCESYVSLVRIACDRFFDCRVRPRVSGQSLADALAAWNRRAAP